MKEIMSYCVVTLTKRAAGTQLASFHQEALRAARERAMPAGCIRSAHSQTLDRGSRGGEAMYDAMDEHEFDDLAAARAWRERAAVAPEGGRAIALLTRTIPLVSGPVAADGLKHVELVCRRAEMDRPGFLAYWRDVHGPLAAAIPTVRRYHQLPATDDEYLQGEPALDGLAVLWFDSTDSMREGARHPAFAATRADMPRLVDTQRSGSLLTREVWSSLSTTDQPQKVSPCEH